MEHSRPKIFIISIFLAAMIIFLIDLPAPFTLPLSRLNKKIKNITFDFQKINFNVGPLKINKNFEYKLGLDLQGGAKIIYSVDMAGIKDEDKKDAHEAARNIIERRINFFGVVEPSIQTLKIDNDYRIIVELPGIKDVQSAIGSIGKTAQLTFWEESVASLGGKIKNLPLGINQIFPKGAEQTSLSGGDLKSAKVAYDSTTGKPQVQLAFSISGVSKFADITKRNVGKPVVIALDNEIIEAPKVNEPILNGSAVISGSFTIQTAKNLAINLNSGALPAPLKILSVSSVGPSLGLDSLRKSIAGGVLGFISVVIFMILLYKKEGFLASFALVVYTVIVLFIFKLIPITLTLAGIAGFILSIGMAVDANILIFERMKEERRLGKSDNLVVELGFSRAWTSIKDSNISSIITCFILYYFGSSLVRNFALTLLIGIMVSLFSAITITRNLLRVFDRKA